MAVVRANCAQACLKLQLYSDAYSHADQCITLNPSSHKVSYILINFNCICNLNRLSLSFHSDCTNGSKVMTASFNARSPAFLEY